MGCFRPFKGDALQDLASQDASSSKVEAIYAPPPGSPPSRRHQDRIPRVSPLERNDDEEYAPPPGPPPSHQRTNTEPPPYHDWTVVPDNALLPPPPSLGHDRSPSSNATESDAGRAHDWCKNHPLIAPHQPTQAQHAAILSGDVRILKPREYKGDLLMPRIGFWKCSTRAGSKDACLLTSSPLYFASADSPFITRTTKTIYFETLIRSLGRGRGADESSIALGYCAMPYPTWRMPGWERGSLAVHGDDGRKYVNDTWGGKDFTSPVRTGETIGLGMSFSISDSPPAYDISLQTSTSIKVEVFFTRNGKKCEGWNLHEELDADNDLGVDGLDGRFDLYGAVGTFGGAEIDVLLNSRDWLWQPR
ncbi:hypothetical protein MMC28_009112 [Mycoblastus sanguinarius]|nr:hypothetical protein [Mycoblastus sanguinarius]